MLTASTVQTAVAAVYVGELQNSVVQILHFHFLFRFFSLIPFCTNCMIFFLTTFTILESETSDELDVAAALRRVSVIILADVASTKALDVRYC